ncbi:MAG TPA: DNA polymerase III subunit alpha [Thioalkalivibrio sp.]|nr:DNA polymerase III subunit alpha [Thioalkalivibrio sp.]
MTWIPLHLHSHWSLLDGVPSIPELLDFARESGLPALALTDANALYGAVDFVVRCRKADIQPIVGVELSLEEDRSAILLAQNQRGYGNLCRLVTLLQARPDRETALARGIPLADLADHTGDLIALADGDTAETLADLFDRDCLFVEIGDPAQFSNAQAQAQRLGLPIVATHPTHYLHPDDARRYRVLRAMREGVRLGDLPAPPDLAFPSQESVQRRFAEFPEALANTARIADACRFDLPLGKFHFPAPDIPSGRTAGETLWERALEGVAELYGEVSPEIEARLRREIDVIDGLGYAPYFLVVADIVRFAHARDVPVSPRGSASSSVVAYCVGIHDVDPIAHNLYFERFLSMERADPPDIDLDLCSRRRDEVIDYVYETYGADHVAMICTYATMRARSALREVGKVYGLPEPRIEQLAKEMPRYWHPRAAKRAKQALTDLLEQLDDPIEREVVEMSLALDGAPHHLSIHPGGIVISPGPITDLVPLQHASKGLLITQYDMKGVEKLGLVKIDLLGISALTVVADCVEMARQQDPGFTLESIPPDDPDTAETLSAARTIGCFQVESPGMRLTLRELAAQNEEDLIVALALYRPGPLTGGLKDAFVRRHLGQEETCYLHPALEPILRETYGVILYQEQVLRIAHEVAGFSLGEADLLRRAMSKHHLHHEMARMKAQFVEGAQAEGGFDEATAEQIWEQMAAFAGYGFPKAHAAGYARVAYRMAYLKTHYPAAYMAARLAVWGGYYRTRVYMAEARNLGLDVRAPHINHSDTTFTLEWPNLTLNLQLPTLWMGLGAVRDLTRVTTKTIIEERPFDALEDFLIRAHPQYGETVNLVKAGAFAGLGNPKGMLMTLERRRWRGRHTGQLGLALSAEEPELPAPTLHERAAWEREVLGTLVSLHPLDLAAAELSAYDLLTSSDRLEARRGQEATTAGVRLSAQRFRAHGGEPMRLVDMEDRAGIYQVLWRGEALKRYREALSSREPVVIRGRVAADRQGLTVVLGREICLLERQL